MEGGYHRRLHNSPTFMTASFQDGKAIDDLGGVVGVESRVDYLGSLEVNVTVVFYSTSVAMATVIILSSRDLPIKVRNEGIVSYPLATSLSRSAMQVGIIILFVPSLIHNDKRPPPPPGNNPGSLSVVVVPQTKTK